MIDISPVNVEAVEIRGAKALDPIIVFWCDTAPSSGYVVITCYGCAWTCYFGSMGGRTIREFFADADVSYLVTKMGITPLLKERKADLAYLGRIVQAVKESIPARRAA